MTSKDQLLPCPFCGGEVEFHEEYPHCDGCHHIYCVKCGMFDLATAADPKNECEELDHLRSRIAPLWNRRAKVDADAVRNDALEEAAQHLECINDKEGDRSAYEQREMLDFELERMYALSAAIETIRALKSSPVAAMPPEGE